MLLCCSGLSTLVFCLVNTMIMPICLHIPVLRSASYSFVYMQPAVWILRPGYTASKPAHSANGRVERSILKQSMFIRVLLACFIVSYPFFIPPFVSFAFRLS
jgi:hypothetical protein